MSDSSKFRLVVDLEIILKDGQVKSVHFVSCIVAFDSKQVMFVKSHQNKIECTSSPFVLFVWETSHNALCLLFSLKREIKRKKEKRTMDSLLQKPFVHTPACIALVLEMETSINIKPLCLR